MKLWPSTLTLSALLLFASPTWAQDADKDAEAEDGHVVAITISPLLLFFPLVEFTGEYKITDKMGVAVLAGMGSIESSVTTNGVTTKATTDLWEVGAQFRYYLLGDFNHGLQAGLELTHLGASAEETEGPISAIADVAGTTVGGYFGYKVAADFGFTLDIQLGAQQIFLQAKGKATGESMGVTVTSTAEETGTVLAPLLNLNMGWSF